MHKKTTFFILISWLMITPILRANSNQDFQSWNILIFTGAINESAYRYWVEGEVRFKDEVSTFSQGLFRYAVGKVLDEHNSLWFGYGWIYNDGEPSNQEQRLWQQYSWQKKGEKDKISARTRFEELQVKNSGEIGWLVRQAFRFDKPLPAPFHTYGFIANEVFIHLLSPTEQNHHYVFDQNRLFVGIGIPLIKKVKTELAYMNLRANRFNRPNFTINSIVLGVQIIGED